MWHTFHIGQFKLSLLEQFLISLPKKFEKNGTKFKAGLQNDIKYIHGKWGGGEEGVKSSNFDKVKTAWKYFFFKKKKSSKLLICVWKKI